jgi:signal recognition particle GTPase
MAVWRAGKVMGMIPGMAEMMPPGSEQEGMRRFKRMMTIMDSMNNDELDSDGKILTQQVHKADACGGCMLYCLLPCCAVVFI